MSTNANPGPIQQMIQRALAARDDIGTPYKLAKRCGWPPASIYRKLKRASAIRTIERMLAALGARVTIDEETIELRLTAKGDVASKRV